MERLLQCLMLITELWIAAAFFSSSSPIGHEFFGNLAEGIVGSSYKGFVPLLLLFVPIFMVTALAIWAQAPPFFLHEVQANSKVVLVVRGLLGMISVDLSCFLYMAANACYITGAYVRHSADTSGYALLGETAKSFGELSLLNLALFLIPVSKHTPLLKALHMPLEVAISFHRLAGTLAIYCAVLHGTMFWVEWSGFGNNLLTKLFPPYVCFQGSKVSGVEAECSSHCNCYALLKNLLGLIAMLAFVGILLTSNEWVRRQHYRVFYICHVVLAPLAFVSVVLHWNRTLLYILPSVTLYAISLSLSLWHTVLNHLRGPDGTTVKFRRISEDITEITVCMEETALLPLAMQWVRLKQIEPLAMRLSPYHPFSVCSVDSSASTFTILFRSSGPFTTSLAQSTRCVVEGFHGSTDRLQQMHSRQQVFLVAGGIGITPFVHTLQALVRQAPLPGSCLREVQLIWSVRDFALQEYVVPLLEQACAENGSNFEINVTVYQTGGSKKGDGSLDETTVHAGVPPRLDAPKTVLFEASPLAVMAVTQMERAVVLIFYCVAMAMAALLTWEFWLHVQEKYDLIVSRIYALVAVWVAMLLFALPFVVVSRRLSKSQAECHRSTPNEEQMELCGAQQLGESVATELVAIQDEESDGSRAEGMGQHAPRAVSQHIQYKEGRPSLGALADINTDTAVFVCGPEQMVSRVRAAASSHHHSCSAGAKVTAQVARPHMVVYEEIFSW